jgi:hypothetical protein
MGSVRNQAWRPWLDKWQQTAQRRVSTIAAMASEVHGGRFGRKRGEDMADQPDVSRRNFLMGRFRRRDPRPDGEAVPGPGGLRGTRRALPEELLHLNTQVTLPDPPAIYDIRLEDSQLGDLLRLLEIEVTQLLVQIRGAPMQEARQTQADLRQVRKALRQGQNVQLRYRHGNVLWSDTFRGTADGAVLTRVRLPQEPAT